MAWMAAHFASPSPPPSPPPPSAGNERRENISGPPPRGPPPLLSAKVALARQKSMMRRNKTAASYSFSSSTAASAPTNSVNSTQKPNRKTPSPPNLLYEDFNNLRLIIDGQERMLRPHQLDALSQLRAGKYTDSVFMDENKRLWYFFITLTNGHHPHPHPHLHANRYRPLRSPVMKEAGSVPPRCEIVQKGSVLALPACAATSYFLQVRFVSNPCMRTELTMTTIPTRPRLR